MVSFTVGMAASVLLADLGYGVMPNVILESVRDWQNATSRPAAPAPLSNPPFVQELDLRSYLSALCDGVAGSKGTSPNGLRDVEYQVYHLWGHCSSCQVQQSRVVLQEVCSRIYMCIGHL